MPSRTWQSIAAVPAAHEGARRASTRRHACHGCDTSRLHLNIVLQGVGGMAVLVWTDRIVAFFEADDTPLNIDVSYAHAN